MLRQTRYFARLGAQSVAPQRRAFTRRAAQRRVQRTRYVHNVFTEPTGRNFVPARANIRRTRTRNAHLTVHNSSSRFLCPWRRYCVASPCLRRVDVKSRSALKRNASALPTLLRRLFVGSTSTRAQLYGREAWLPFSSKTCKCGILLKRQLEWTYRKARGLVEVRWYSEFQAGPILYKPQCRSRRVLPMSATRVCFTGTCPRASPGGTGSLNRRNRQIKRGNFARAPTTTTAHGMAEWLFANGGECSAVRAGVSSRGRGLFAVRDVRTGESIVRIPLKACITDFLHPIPIRVARTVSRSPRRS